MVATQQEEVLRVLHLQQTETGLRGTSQDCTEGGALGLPCSTERHCCFSPKPELLIRLDRRYLLPMLTVGVFGLQQGAAHLL